MRKKILFGIIAATMALSVMGCSKESDSDDAKATKEAEATKEAAKESEDKSDDSDVVKESELIEGSETHYAVDGDGNEIDPSTKAETPSLDDYPKGAYVDTDGSICIEDNGNIKVLWSPYVDLEKQIAEKMSAEQDAEKLQMIYSPSYLTKESNDLVILGDDGKVIEALDSSDKDYCDVYAVIAEYLENMCDTTDKEEMKKRILRQKELSASTVDFQIDVNTFDFDSITENTTLESVCAYKVAFNKDKTGCRIYTHSINETNGEQQGYDDWWNLTKVDGKWLIASEGDYPVLEAYIKYEE